MDAKEFINLIQFFNSVSITENDVTTPAEKNNGQLVVEVTYYVHGKSYTTQKLYYKDIANLDRIDNKQALIDYFGSPIYWLDLDHHDWPQGAGESDLEKIVIPEIATKGDTEFITFLRSLANNKQTGFIQQITADGRSAQYYHNLENNNHWHDLVVLIKAFISSGGEDIDKKYFSRLIFNWSGDKHTQRARATLTNKAFPCSRKIIEELKKNIKSVKSEIMKSEVVELLKNKKQIILQGPPGTGKTRLAKELATELCSDFLLQESHRSQINSILTTGLTINTVEGSPFSIENAENGSYKLKIGAGTAPYSITTDQIIKVDNEPAGGISGKSYARGLAAYVKPKIAEQNIELIQFHPAYSYEDFVRGISVKTEDGVPNYYSENKTLGILAAKALANYEKSRMATTELSKEYWIENKFDEFKFFLQSDLEITGPLTLTESVKLKKIEDDAFRYSGTDWGNSSRINFKDFIKLAIHNLERQDDIEITKELSLHAFYRKTYYTALLNHFYDKAGSYTPTNNVAEPLKNYVLIIDEINRANLPSVLGELIYALEYRGEPVKSIYKIAEDSSLVLPPNLFIIGTMNTADRSVGHIDYAIRRRFAFVEVLPSDEVIDQVVTDAVLKQKSKSLYSSIASLFTKDKIASDFNAKDVQLGHSYFLAQTEPELKRKLEFEIKPILREYLKDGILLNETASEIENLSV